MFGGREVVAESKPINATFLNWGSASIVNPKSGFHFCDGWFVTSVARGRPMDIALQPLNPEADSGFRLLMRNPPEQVRIWHRLPDGVLESRLRFVKVRVRGLSQPADTLQLDSIGLFFGDEASRKIDRQLIGEVVLDGSWQEFAVELRGSGTTTEGASYLSLRFSGKGTIELDYCRLQAKLDKMSAWPTAKSIAVKVLSGFPRRRTVPMASQTDARIELEASDSPVGVAPLESDVSVPLVELDTAEDKPEEKALANVASEPQKEGANFLRNPAFLSWSGASPTHWKPTLPNGVSIRQGQTLEDSPFKAGGIVLAIDTMRPDRTVWLSQGVSERLKPKQILNFAIVGSADMRTEIGIALRGKSNVANAATATVILGPRWQFRTARITVPANFNDEGATIGFAIRGDQAKLINLAFVAAGASGEDIAGQFEVLELPERNSNALRNGKFDHWSGPLRRSSSSRRTEITDDWALVNKTPSPNMEARLTEIVPRGLRDGGEHQPVAGIAVHGEVEGSYVRMEASLDILQIVSGPPRRLRFYARTASANPETGSQRYRSAIQQIFIAERCRVAPNSSESEVIRLFTVKRNLRIGRIGELHVIDLRSDHRAGLLSKAKEMLHDVDRSLLLVFECSGFADVAIGDVYCGNDIAVEEEEIGSANKVIVEDHNIASQLTYLKGIAHWQSPLAIAPSPNRVQAISSAQANWTWLPNSKLTLDIVICVHNAVEETLDCLQSLQRHTTVPHTVTIIDDKSSEVTRERLRHYVAGKPWIRLLENPTNLGYTRSANIGLSSSSAEWVILLNSDTIVTPGWVEGLFDVVNARPNVVMVGPLSNAASWQSVPDLHDVKGGWSVNPIPEGFSILDVAQLVADLSPKQFPEATLLNGFCTLMRRDVVEQLGYLDEVAFPMGYGEENDLCLRVRKAGYSLALADHVYVFHVKSASFGSARRSELSKRGTAQLHLKHPDVDMKETQREMAELTSLTTLRKKLRQSFGSAAPLDVQRVEQASEASTEASLTH